MKIFLDTANLDEIRQAALLGVLDGVTTNPTLVAKEKKSFHEHILDICEIFENAGVKDAVVNAEVVSTNTEGMPREGIRMNMTLVFSATQALLVAKAGATFVSPFLGRLDDISQDGMTVLREILEIYRAYNFKTQVLAASLRGPMHVLEAARLGAHIGTMPYKVFEQLFKHPLTDKGLEGFLKDWATARESLGDILGTPVVQKAGR